MKLYETTLTREECLREYRGYTEIEGKRYALKDFSSGFWVHNNAIIFGYAFDSRYATTGFTQATVDAMLLESPMRYKSKLPTFGGYVNQEGIEIEENGYMLVFDENVSPVSLGAAAHKIADMFRQESVLVIYNGEVSFVYV